MNRPSIISGLLWLAGVVTSAEAVKIQAELIGLPVAKDWHQFTDQIQGIIGHSIIPGTHI